MNRCAYLRATVCAGLLVLGGVRAEAGTLVVDTTIVHDGVTRYFDYYVPDGLSTTPVPLHKTRVRHERNFGCRMSGGFRWEFVSPVQLLPSLRNSLHFGNAPLRSPTSQPKPNGKVHRFGT